VIIEFAAERRKRSKIHVKTSGHVYIFFHYFNFFSKTTAGTSCDDMSKVKPVNISQSINMLNATFRAYNLKIQLE